MRVISGKFKYKRLFSPVGKDVRPTTDRIKETLFSILTSHGFFQDSVVLDLFSGTGALGIESISRGAAKAVFIDKSRDSYLLTKKNLEHVGASADEYEIYNVDYEFALKKLKGRRFDVIFADPPYAMRAHSKILSLIKRYDLLSSGGMVVVEHDSSECVTDEDFNADTRKCGTTALTFFRKKEV
jgi:16S rRNA (guanine(966)-N(2))-methyltransferase RsmD